MPTDRQRIETTLRQLESDLSEPGQLEPEVRHRLNAVLADVRAALDRPPAIPPSASTASPKPTSSAVNRLSEAALHLEETHPALSTTLGTLAGWLGQLGF